MTSRRVYTKRQLAVLLFPVRLSLQRVTAASHVCRRLSNTIRQPCSESQLPHMSAGDSPTRSGRVWCSVLWGHCSFLLGPEACKILCVSSKSGGSVHPGLVEVLQSNPADLQSQIPWDTWSLSLSLLDPQAEKPDMGLRTFTRVGALLCYNCSPVCWLPTHWVWYLILSWLHSSSHLVVTSSLSLDVEYLFWWVQISMVLQ